MTVAQLFKFEGAAQQEQVDRAREVATATRQLDGSEGVFLIGESGYCQGIGIAVWRDSAAMQAAGAKIAADIAEGKEVGITVTPGEVYDTVILL